MSAPIEIALPGEPVIGGLAFPECPRWHQGAWWFSDMHAQRVYRIDTNGRLSTVIELDDRPAGLSFQGDRMFVVGMTKQELLSIEDGRIVKCISLRDHAPFHCNDMVMDQAGRAQIQPTCHKILGAEAKRHRGSSRPSATCRRSQEYARH